MMAGRAGFVGCLTVAAVAALWATAGCRARGPVDPIQLRDEAIGVLSEQLENQPTAPTDPGLSESARQAALQAQYQLQTQALEVLAEFPTVVQPRWLGQAMRSTANGVVYAAVLTIGRLADYENGRFSKPFVGQVRTMAVAGNPFLRVAAAYALYRMGEVAAAERLADILHSARPLFADLSGEQAAQAEATVRAEAVTVLSMMPELSPAPLIRSLASERDPGPQVGVKVRIAQLGLQMTIKTRLAVLGDKRAIDQLYNLLNGASGDDRFDAAQALGRAAIEDLEPLRNCLRTDSLPEVRMAAARALGLHKDRSGLALALEYLNFDDSNKLTRKEIAEDPLHAYRVRFLAALALGAIGDYDRSAGPLLDIIRRSASNQYRMYAARAALELLARTRLTGELNPPRPSRAGPAPRAP